MSIIKEENKIKSNYFQFKKVGDKLEGTYVGKRVKPNMLRGGEEQAIYEIKKDDGEYIDVYGKAGIDMQMKRIKFGQIVGFEFVKQIPATRPGYKPTNVIQVYADPKVVDEKWIMENEDAGVEPEGGITAVEVNSAPGMSSVELLKAINNYAVTKLGATDAASVKQKVMEKTNLAFLDANLQTIWDTLQQLPS